MNRDNADYRLVITFQRHSCSIRQRYTPKTNSMKKQDELNLKFYKKMGAFNEFGYHLDASNANGEYKRLCLIPFFPKIVITYLIETIYLIQNNQPYDPSFLNSAEEFYVFDVKFSNPYFSFDGHQTIHMDDLKIVLEEWIAFTDS
jgi:hypothetical protein